jgi:hypothetical protein
MNTINPPAVITTQTDYSYGWVIFFVVIIIIIILLVVVFWFFIPTGGRLAINSLCNSNLDCLSGICSDGICVGNIPPIGGNNVPAGGTCNINSNCISGLNCVSGVCLAPIGGVCTSLSGCVSGATACLNNICVNTPLSGPGGRAPCRNGLITDNNGICRVPMSGTCSRNSDCVSGKCINGLCANGGGGNGTGNGDINGRPPCGSNLIDDNGVCKVPIGGICSKNNDCTNNSGGCVDGICSDFSGGINSTCNNTSNCAQGYTCEKGKCKIGIDSSIPCGNDKMCVNDGKCVDNICTIDDCDSSSNSSSSCESNSSSDSCNSCGSNSCNGNSCNTSKRKSSGKKSHRRKSHGRNTKDSTGTGNGSKPILKSSKYF